MQLRSTLVMAALCVLASTSSALSDTSIPAVGLLRNVKKDVCLDVKHTAPDIGNIQLGNCVGEAAGDFDPMRDQVWGFDGLGHLVNGWRYGCMNVVTNDAKSRDNVALGTCSTQLAQRWTLFERDGAFEIRNKKSGLCLDVKGYNGASGDNVMLYACDGKPDQLWRLDRTSAEAKSSLESLGMITSIVWSTLTVPDPTAPIPANLVVAQTTALDAQNLTNPVTFRGLFTQVPKGMCFDQANYDGAPGRLAALYPCDGYPDQTYELDTKGRLINQAQKMCLDPAGTDAAVGSRIGLAVCDGSADQTWRVGLDHQNGTAAIRLINRKSSKCIGRTTSEQDTPLLLQECGQEIQQWMLRREPLIPTRIEFALWNPRHGRFVRVNPDGTVGATEAIELRPFGTLRYRRDGTATFAAETAGDVVSPGLYQTVFTAEDVQSSGLVWIKSKAGGRYLTFDASGVRGTPGSGTTKIEGIPVAGGRIALRAFMSNHYMKTNPNGTLAVSSPSGGVLPADWTYEQFEVVPVPSEPPAIAAKSGANADCVFALSCMIDAGLQKFLDPLCGWSCANAKDTTVGKFFAALQAGDRLAMCQSGLKAAIDITELAFSTSVLDLAQEATKTLTCGLFREDYSPVCGYDTSCQEMLAGQDPCDTRQKAAELANGFCSAKSYGRGAGTVLNSQLRCDSPYVQDAALCYPPCFAGFKGVGPVCWKI